MIGYGTSEGSRRTLAVMRLHGWRLLLTPDHPKLYEGFRYGLDNGAWSYHRRGVSFDCERFKGLVERYGAGADFVVMPDIVEGGDRSLGFSLSWHEYLKPLRLLLLPLQDGVSADLVGRVLRAYPNVGLFLGGSTAWKLREIYAWGLVAHSHGRYYHIGRVNSLKRIRLAMEAGAHSFDGTGATRYGSRDVPLLESGIRQPHLFSAGSEVL